MLRVLTEKVALGGNLKISRISTAWQRNELELQITENTDRGKAYKYPKNWGNISSRLYKQDGGEISDP